MQFYLIVFRNLEVELKNTNQYGDADWGIVGVYAAFNSQESKRKSAWYTEMMNPGSLPAWEGNALDHIYVWSRSVMPSSLQPYGLQPTRILHPWDFPGKSTAVGCYSHLQGIFLTQGLNPGLLHCRETFIIWATREAHYKYESGWNQFQLHL